MSSFPSEKISICCLNTISKELAILSNHNLNDLLITDAYLLH
jgi:hypothetical protein